MRTPVSSSFSFWFFVTPEQIALTGRQVNAESDFSRCANCRGGYPGATTSIAVRCASAARARVLDRRSRAGRRRQFVAPASTRSGIDRGRFDLPQIEQRFGGEPSRVRRALRPPATVGRGLGVGAAGKASYFKVILDRRPLGRARRRGDVPCQLPTVSNLSISSNLWEAGESMSTTPASNSSISIACASRIVAPL